MSGSGPLFGSTCAVPARLPGRPRPIDGIALRYGMFYGPRAFSDLFADLMRKRTPVAPRGGGDGVEVGAQVSDPVGVQRPQFR